MLGISAASVFLVLSLLGNSFANTEIINFSTVLSPDRIIDASAFNVSWNELDTQSGTRQFSLALAPYKTPWSEICASNGCAHEMFFKLGTETKVGKYSLRISWPASIPADFDMEVFTPSELHDLLSSRANSTHQSHSDAQTQTTYARIRARDAGVQSPLITEESQRRQIFKPLIPLPQDPPIVIFHLILDPLIFSVLPRSVVPILGWLGGAIVLGFWAVKPVTRLLERVAMRVNLKEE
ncbi:hypothetical protein BDV93DRAFT_549305 [Ceratobasidium sp. AG-I]|nr:hypothetical protein BDV93DRAFT_549305 [Ceratobasidium sp. AG-I]